CSSDLHLSGLGECLGLVANCALVKLCFGFFFAVENNFFPLAILRILPAGKSDTAAIDLLTQPSSLSVSVLISSKMRKSAIPFINAFSDSLVPTRRLFDLTHP